jgi:ribosomal protein S27AE
MTREERRARKLARAVSQRVSAILEAQRLEARSQAAARGVRAKPSALPEATRAGVLRWRRAHPEGPRAHKLVYAAVRAGRIPRPDRCEGCGRGVRLHGHHEDYTKPLKVRWLCGSCHRLAHGSGRAEGAIPKRVLSRRPQPAAPADGAI